MSVNLKHFNYSPAYLDLELFLNPQMDPEIKKLINFFTKQILFGGSVDKTRQWLISKTPFCFLINWQFLAKCFLIISPSHIMDMDVTSSLFLCPFNRVYLGFFLRNINRFKTRFILNATEETKLSIVSIDIHVITSCIFHTI